jgi:hypothetical protein
MGFFDKLKGMIGDKAKEQAEEASGVSVEADDSDDSDDEAQEASSDDDDSSSDDSDDDEADDWGGWDQRNWEEYWYRLKNIEQAGNDHGDDAADAKCREYGLRDFRHMQRVRDTFSRHFGHIHEFMQAAFNANQRSAREMLGAAGNANSEIFEPIEGVTLQTYATIQARVAGGAQGDAYKKLLHEYGLDEARWSRVSGGWTQRMSGQGVSDPNATYALLAEYGKFFGQAGVGQHGASAAANAANAGVYQTGHNAPSQEPCTLERYAEIMGAQSAWAQQGRDVNQMLQSQFSMTALDWSNISQYWSAKIGTDYRIGVQLGDLMTKYEQRYMAAGGGGADSDLNV